VNTIMPLMNAMAFMFEYHGIEVNYGLARGLGSIAYAVTSLILGNIVNMYDALLIPIFYIIFSALMYIVVRIYVLPKNYQDTKVDVEKEIIEGKKLSFIAFCTK